MSDIDVVEPVRRPGQFVKGHSVKSPGRPPKPRVDYLGILKECLTEDEHRAIIRRAILDARNGSYRAREWIYKHLISPFPRVAQLELSVVPETDIPLCGDDWWDGVADASYRAAIDEMSADELATMDKFIERHKQKNIELRNKQTPSV